MTFDVLYDISVSAVSMTRLLVFKLLTLTTGVLYAEDSRIPIKVTWCCCLV